MSIQSLLPDALASSRTMAKTAALNPASTPFFPGSMRLGEDDGGSLGPFGLAVPTPREQDRAFLSASPVGLRSVRSSPALQDNETQERLSDMRLRPSPPAPDVSSPARYPELDRSYGLPRTREMSVVGNLEALPEADDTLPSITTDERARTPADSPFFSATNHQSKAPINSPPVNIMNNSSRSSVFNANAPFVSSSPASSLDSGSQFISSADFSQNLDAQLKTSPLIQDIIERLLRCEFTAQEVQRELRDVHRKVDFLVERSFNNAPQASSSQPEFKDPFAPTGGQPATSLTVPRASFSAGIAPNQSPPPDDISQISQRLNTLTTSVGQLLALQTQQHIQTATTLGRLTPHTPDLPPNQPFGGNISPNPALLNHGLPNRPELRAPPRAPNPPTRTWSAGNLDLPLRADNIAALGRNDLVRDKRRSITGGLMRRESVGVSIYSCAMRSSDLTTDRSLMDKVVIGQAVLLATVALWFPNGSN